MDIQFKSGDTVKVHLKILESEKVKGASKSKNDVKEELKERIQIFEGVVLKVQGTGSGKSFTVRKIAAGKVGVERTWPVECPTIAKVEVVKKGNFNRAKLYYLRNLDLKQATKDSK
jgi:large subunit ribosomal protein L19